jgi:hypothetical protein
MAIIEQRRTDRFILRYDDGVLGAQTLAQNIGDFIEADFFKLRQYLPFDNDKSPDIFQKLPTIVTFMALSSAAALGIPVGNLPGPGAANNSSGVESDPSVHPPTPGFRSGIILINANGAGGGTISLDFARFVFIAEMSEQLMPAHGYVPGGNRVGASRGEALSRILAEAFFPEPAYLPQCSSIAPWVNQWLNSSPRPDYINTNPAPTPANPTLGSDTDQTGYGCGILFFNYLQSQLGYPLQAILGAGGVTLADAYKGLTGNSDDPLAAMNALLSKHYPPGGISLRNNNPFPLYDANKRIVTLGFDRTTTDLPRIGAFPRIPHTAHVSPFITCPAKDYLYWYVSRAVTWTIDATTVGFLVPSFQWTVQITPLIVASGAVQATVPFDVPQPTGPATPKPSTGAAHFSYKFQDTSTKSGSASQLTVTNLDHAGLYHLEISVEVSETYAPDQPTVAKATVGFDTLAIRYEDAFYQDKLRCESRFEHAIPVLVKQVQLVPLPPDPPDPGYLSELIAHVDRIRELVGEIGRANPDLAPEAAAYAGARLGIDPKLLLGTSKTGLA